MLLVIGGAAGRIVGQRPSSVETCGLIVGSSNCAFVVGAECLQLMDLCGCANICSIWSSPIALCGGGR